MIRFYLCLLLAGGFAASVGAQEFSQPSKRAHAWEMGFLINQVDSWDTNARNGSSIDVDSDTGWGFSIAYNVNEYFNIGFEFAHNEQSYDALVIPDTVLAIPEEISHELTNDFYSFNFTYNILPKTFTPFVVGTLGWNYLDSNVSDGDISVACWWDPWWGYICNDYFSSYEDTSFSYGVGAGVRWEISGNFLMKASINQRWVDLDAAGDTPDMLSGKLEFIWSLF